MKTTVKICIAVVLLLLYSGTILFAQRITEAQARRVTDNWITLTEYYNNGWGSYENAEVEKIDILTIDNKQVGYYCQIAPEGFIILSLYKGLAPVKAFETHGNLKAQPDDELLLYLMQRMRSIIDAIENNLGSMDGITAIDLSQILEIDYSNAWEVLDIQNEQFIKQLKSGNWDNYQEGDTLINSMWGQRWPFNKYCPYLGCTGNYNGHAPAGCAPIAAAQVMRYWNWPPFHDGDIYDWTHMPHSFNNFSTAADTHYVAKLIYEIGEAAGSDYDCNGTITFWAGWPGADLEDAFKEHFIYDENCDATYRRNHTANGWYDILKGQLNINRPLPYMNTNHAFVCDGWKEIYVLGVLIKMYHMNWGHTGSNTDWYALDAIPNPNQTTESALKEIYPRNSVGPGMAGSYGKDPGFPYRYFDQDTWGLMAIFFAGQKLQFLHNIVVTGAGIDPYYNITFQGATNDQTLLFSQGDPSKGIQIKDGAISLRAGGSIQFKKYNY